jgi:hypothetical protein
VGWATREFKELVEVKHDWPSKISCRDEFEGDKLTWETGLQIVKSLKLVTTE